MDYNTLNQPQLIGLGVGAVFLLVLALWISWKLSKLLIRVSFTLLVLATMGGAIWWFFLRP